MNKSKILFFLFFAGLIAIASCKDDDDDNTLDCDTVKFSTTIQPIIENSCALSGCHDAGSVNGDYSTYAGLETLAKDGTMEKQVITDKTMPKGTSNTLTQDELDKFQCWFDGGALDN